MIIRFSLDNSLKLQFKGLCIPVSGEIEVLSKHINKALHKTFSQGCRQYFVKASPISCLNHDMIICVLTFQSSLFDSIGAVFIWLHSNVKKKKKLYSWHKPMKYITKNILHFRVMKNLNKWFCTVFHWRNAMLLSHRLTLTI